MAYAITALTLVVLDYDEAIKYFTEALRFELVEDTDMGGGKRWVVVAPRLSQGASLQLAKAANVVQEAAIGNQTGGRVFLFLHTHDFEEDYQHMQAYGVEFTEEPRDEVFGKVVVFKDLYGNKWDLIQRK